MEKNKKILWIIGIVVFIIIVFLCFQTLKVSNQSKSEQNSTLSLILDGEEIITLEVGETYQEPGYHALDKEEGNLTDKVSVQSTLNTEVPGTYTIIYTITNKNGEKTEMKRYITVEGNKKISYQNSYDDIDNTLRTWWSGNKKDHSRPVEGAGNKEEVLKQYNAYYMGKDEPIIYLTFDEGTTENYVEEIVEVLNKNEVKATFFLCEGFMNAKPDVIKKVANSGHSVGNHTANHASMPPLATRTNFEKYLNELEANEKTYEKITGKKMDKVYREPRGEYSYRSLQIIHDLGYKTFFWSADYYDFDFQVSKEKALSELEKRYHNGAIYLMHSTNKGNYEALDDFIKNMKELGYTFGLVRYIS